jgi:hypothetical protein
MKLINFKSMTITTSILLGVIAALLPGPLHWYVMGPLTAIATFVGILLFTKALAINELFGMVMIPSDLAHIKVGNEIIAYVSANYAIDRTSGTVYGTKKNFDPNDYVEDVVMLEPLWRSLLGPVTWSGNIYAKVGIITKEDDGTPTISYSTFEADQKSLKPVVLDRKESIPYKISIGVKSAPVEIEGGDLGQGSVWVNLICTIPNLADFLLIGPDFYHTVTSEFNSLLTVWAPGKSYDDFVNIGKDLQFKSSLNDANTNLSGATNGGIQGLIHLGIRVESVQFIDIDTTLAAERRKKGEAKLKGEADLEAQIQANNVLEQKKVGEETQAKIDMIKAKVKADSQYLQLTAENKAKWENFEKELEILRAKGVTAKQIAEIQKLERAFSALPEGLKTIVAGGNSGGIANLLNLNSND